MFSLYLSMLNTSEEKDQFSELYYRYRDLMYQVAFHILRDRSLAEDALHDAFLKLADHLYQVEDIDSSKTKHFLVIIVRNISLNELKRRKRFVDSSVEDLAECLSDDKETEQITEDSESFEQFVQLIRSLPSDYADMLFLHYDQGMTVKNIGKLMGLTEAAVYKKIERAKRALSVKLQEKDGTYAVK